MLHGRTLSRHDGQGSFSRDVAAAQILRDFEYPKTAGYIGMSACWPLHRAVPQTCRYVFFFVASDARGAAIAYSVEPIHWIVAHLPMIKSLKNGSCSCGSFGLLRWPDLVFPYGKLLSRR